MGTSTSVIVRTQHLRYQQSEELEGVGGRSGQARARRRTQLAARARWCPGNGTVTGQEPDAFIHELMTFLDK